VVHGVCSGAAFFIVASRLPAVILLLHCTQAPLAGYRNSPLSRPWPPMTLCHKYVFRCFRTMFSSVSSGYCLYCNGYIRMLQVYISSVSDVCFKCFIFLLQEYIWMLHNMHVANICIKCFRCFIRMLQVFYPYVAKVELDVACVCNGFQVFSGILQLF
jgi:hypothetical protein